DLVGLVLGLLLLAAEAPRLPQEQPGDVRRRLRPAHAGDVAVGEAGDALHAAEAAAAGDLRIEHQLAEVAIAVPQPRGRGQRAGHRRGLLSHRQQAPRAGVQCVERAVQLRDHRRLGVGAEPRVLRLLLLLLLLVLLPVAVLLLLVRLFLFALLLLTFPGC